FDTGEFYNFWFSTGTPTFLVNLLKGRNQVQIGKVLVDQSAFESYDIENLDTLPLLFQTGYSTIKEKREFGIFLMDYPNREVETSLLRHLIGSYRHHSAARTTPVVIQLRQAFLDQEIEQIITIINSLFQSIPSHIFIKEKEAYYHSLVYLVFQYLGQFIEAEVNTATGRIDAVVYTDSQVYVLEFKLDASAEVALKQIREKGYADKYLTSGKKVLAMGINFSSTEKQVTDWKMESY
ncbi:MAG: PD-(D/E)XK nuclease domain-containing protein, partial [Bacteroidota bacterium]